MAITSDMTQPVYLTIMTISVMLVITVQYVNRAHLIVVIKRGLGAGGAVPAPHR
jgi:hypothetical protein